MARNGPPYEMLATLARDPENQPIVAVFAKRTYDLLPGGKLRFAEKQLPLVREEAVEKRDDRPSEVMLAELDTWPIKLATDVVVLGKVHAEKGKPVPEMAAGIKVGAHGKAVRVIGDRRVDYEPGRRPVFSSPTPFAEMDLTYWRAYGGIDASLVAPEPANMRELIRSLTPEEKPGAYPRNPAGVGYVVSDDPRAVHGLALPNFEDPANPLAPEKLIVRDPALWWKMPLPQGLSWFHGGCYPRSALFGLRPRFAPPDDTEQVEEVRRGYLPKGRCKFLEAASVDRMIDFRAFNGASPGLVVPYLKGNEAVRLVGLAPEGEIQFALAGEQPEVTIRFAGKALAPTLLLHTLLIEPDEKRYSVVWCARARTPRFLPDRMPTAEDLMYDMLEGFEIAVDGVELAHRREKYQPKPMFG